jgi:hypothetical protein
MGTGARGGQPYSAGVKEASSGRRHGGGASLLVAYWRKKPMVSHQPLAGRVPGMAGLSSEALRAQLRR